MSSPQNRLENAEQRLAKAIGRLEGALEARAARGDVAGAGVAAELSRLQSENAQLQGLVGQASTRLDATIAKLKQHTKGSS